MSDIYSMPGHLIRRLQQISTSVFTDGVKAHGFDLTSPQFAALSILRTHPHIDQATLAGLIAYDRPTIGGVIDRLVSKGLVRRETSTRDRRSKSLSLTDEGEAVLEHLTPIVAQIQDALLPGLTPAERADFIRLAAKIADAGNSLSRAPLNRVDPEDGAGG